MKHEYHEGSEALKRFERFTSAILQAKKTTVPAKAQAKKRASQRKSGKAKA
jgi:hypothetical protein